MSKYEPKRPGDVILIVVPNYWAKAPTFPQAAAQLRREGGGTVTERTPASKMKVWSAHPQSFCDEVHGGIVRPLDHVPILLN